MRLPDVETILPGSALGCPTVCDSALVTIFRPRFVRRTAKFGLFLVGIYGEEFRKPSWTVQANPRRLLAM